MISPAQILDALRQRTGFPWASVLFELPSAFPYGLVIADDSPALSADNQRYLPFLQIRLELYDARPNPDAETIIETYLNDNFPAWRKSPREPISPDAESFTVWATSYEFEVI